MSEQQKQVKAALKECVARIKELKAIKRANKEWKGKDEPGWVHGPLGLELEIAKLTATVLCAARALSRKRVHKIRVPRLFTTAWHPWTNVRTQEEFAAFVDGYVQNRFPAPPAEQAAPPDQRQSA